MIALITNFRSIDKGALKGFFTLKLDPDGMGLVISDCKYFSKDGREWFAFPSKDIIRNGKQEYFNFMKFKKEFLESINQNVLNQLKLSRENAPKKEITQARDVPDKSFFDWDTDI